MSLNRQEFTNSGRDMLGRANNGEALTINYMVIGSGRANAPADLWPRDEVFEHQLDVAFSQRIDLGGGLLLCEGSFNSTQAAARFDLCEVGVMAHIGNEPDRLYCLANVLATGADVVDPSVQSVHAFKVKVQIDRATNVTVVIGTSQDIMGENIGAATIGPGWFESKIANTLRFKRAVEGEGIELFEEPETVTIRQKQLRINLDLYVPLNHPAAPGPEVAFPTIQAAHDYLLAFVIPPNRRATIHVAAGTHPFTTRIFHPNASQITIRGPDPVRVPVTAVANSNPTAFNVTVPSMAGFSVDQIVKLGGGLNEIDFPWRGSHRIIDVTALPNTVYMEKGFRGGIDFFTPGTGFTTTYLEYETAIINVSGTALAAFDLVTGCTIENFAIVNSGTVDRAVSALNTNGVIILRNLQFYGFTYGVYLLGARADIYNVSAAMCNWGISAIIGSVINVLDEILIVGATVVGLIAQSSSINAVGFAMVSVNGCILAISSEQSSWINIGFLFIGISEIGILATRVATVSIGISIPIPNYIWSNGTDVTVSYGGIIYGNRRGGRIDVYVPPNNQLNTVTGGIIWIEAVAEEEEAPEHLPDLDRPEPKV